ncbi:uncharacterized protein LOC111715735 [Eurytemora carolleeae]|uniref:uncharacterized protein LOC111715735 n=1 Tax=Eurytemora carolleeae TaxID=1294199 RepID=UPI000C76A363|nr:uncharacterized protein LOC111715735 [Eurytemora carolleeae]|eukprot:XP_023346873.1 uncharacterized protein LOC111715735 [Eurytemora affinis]
MAAGMIAESTSRMVKQRSMEALDKLRTYTGNPDSRRPSSTSVQMLVNSINASVRPIKADGGRADGKADTDPEVIDNASKFVQDIIEKAKVEAARRLDTENLGLMSMREKKPEPTATKWKRRASSFAFRMYAAIFSWCNGR